MTTPLERMREKGVWNVVIRKKINGLIYRSRSNMKNIKNDVHH